MAKLGLAVGTSANLCFFSNKSDAGSGRATRLGWILCPANPRCSSPPLPTPVEPSCQPHDFMPCSAATPGASEEEALSAFMDGVAALRAGAARVPDEVLVCLVGNMEMLVPKSPYHSVIYGAFQERATFVSHVHTARLAGQHGDQALAKICGVIAADEKRHEAGYTRVCAKLFEVDPDGMVRALAHVMRGKVTMPGLLMSDGHDAASGENSLFERFSAVAQSAGVYTARDYGDLVEHFVRRWRVAELAGLSGEGRRAQEYVCGLPPKIRRMEELAHQRAARSELRPARFSWIFDRHVMVG
ncbi:Acyl-[acyl-carrier-protein] desaturase 4, chloroplastic [Triticum urartu]|uniref:Acyl-[acyl-carrier-protein] desaturase 4, chloroplastic n=1 Tax=Triticum urartu TaxID=4572 RepID=M7Z6V0_TRIUA|nr:Acyl-[acyl-carrier-protein] desaturase 4, chloroplastic [Triticum urartu]